MIQRQPSSEIDGKLRRAARKVNRGSEQAGFNADELSALLQCRAAVCSQIVTCVMRATRLVTGCRIHPAYATDAILIVTLQLTAQSMMHNDTWKESSS
jgi:hypothetical protein